VSACSCRLANEKIVAHGACLWSGACTLHHFQACRLERYLLCAGAAGQCLSSRGLPELTDTLNE
jgi:hypothetical protein